jgi:hypothetical protein
MSYGVLADLVVVVHLAYVAFVVAGALLLLRWPRLAWLHLPAVAWAALLEAFGWTCPLTPLENRLRALAAEPGYERGFVEHYLVPIVYPETLDRAAQLALAAGVVALNAALYAFVLRRRRRARAW